MLVLLGVVQHMCIALWVSMYGGHVISDLYKRHTERHQMRATMLGDASLEVLQKQRVAAR